MTTRRALVLLLMLIATVGHVPASADVFDEITLTDCGQLDPDRVVPVGCIGRCTSQYGVVACITPGTIFLNVPVSLVAPAEGATHTVIGTVDVYRFVLPGGIVTTLPCVVLTIDGSTTDPCAEAGGTFASRLFAIEESENEPSAVFAPWMSLRICNATLRATVGGIGIESAPAYALC